VGEIVLSFLFDSVVLAVIVCIALVVLLATFAVRRRVLVRRGGAFGCALRRKHAGEITPRGWILGLARYGDDQIEWFRIFSLSPRPSARLDRRALSIVRRRAPDGMEAYAVPHDSVILVCSAGDGAVDLAVPEAAATALHVWLEAVPPGAHLESA
jgi:hypothetical protein